MHFSSVSALAKPRWRPQSAVVSYQIAHTVERTEPTAAMAAQDPIEKEGMRGCGHQPPARARTLKQLFMVWFKHKLATEQPDTVESDRVKEARAKWAANYEENGPNQLRDLGDLIQEHKSGQARYLVEMKAYNMAGMEERPEEVVG